MTRVHLEDIHVRYPVLRSGRASSLFRQLAKSASFGAIGRGDHSDIAYVHALRGLTLDLREGDRLGLIGRNGAGKSTLLRAIAGLSWPQSGVREVDGHISCMLNPNAGVDLEKNGWDNIDFVGRLFGLPKPKRDAIAEDIAAFTELGEYLSLPVRTYSAGMMVRLSFAIATSLPGDVFVIDEVIGAGDAFFMERARARARSFFGSAKIMIMASHSDGVLRDFCNKGLWLDHGVAVDFGPLDEVIDRYNAQTPRFPEGGHPVVFEEPEAAPVLAEAAT
jgi:ABC-type polysaccharide/polyol phosphate transport system ATPase subunit